MINQIFGGNTIGRFDLKRLGRQVFGTGPYLYYFHHAVAGEELVLNELRSFTVYVFDRDRAATVRVVENAVTLDVGDCVQAEGCDIRIAVIGGAAQFLVAGTETPHPSEHGLTVRRHAEIYKVAKPWGHELWINGQHPRYALKQIFVKAGTKTSLQYHNFKQETNVLFSGCAKLHYKANSDVPNDKVTHADIATVQIEPVSTVGVTPPTLHRLEAVTDILLYETSTPHLDDVVRVQDDSRRPDGRIATEHAKS